MKKQTMCACMTLILGLVGLTGCGASQGKTTVDELQAKFDALEKRVTALEGQTSSAQPNVTGTPATVAATSPQAFTDVDASVPAADMINDLAQLKVFNPASGEFKPYQPITRGEYIIWLYNAYNAMHPPEKQIRMAPAFKVPFTDLKPEHPSYKYVQALSNGGFSVGYENKTFKPDQPLTREEMIAIKHGVDGGEMYSDVSIGFADEKLIDPKYHAAIYADRIFVDAKPRGDNILRAFGAIKTFKPKEPVLRNEAAATLWQTDHRGRITADIALGRTKPQ